jgi:hypothetical protein
MRQLFSSIALFLFMTTTGQAAACYEAMIQEPQPFLGNGEEIIILSDGSIWKNMSYLYLYLYAYHPTVIICPGDGNMILNNHVFNILRVR